MQTSTSTFATLIEGQHVTRARRVTIDFPPGVDYDDATVICESYDPEQQTTTDMPDEATLGATGYAAASCDVVLSGRVDPTDAGRTIAWLCNEFDPTSPLYRTDGVEGLKILVEEGIWVGDPAGVPELLPIFTGRIDTKSINFDTGEVTLNCIDLRDDWRALPMLPSFAAAIDTTLVPGLSGHYVLDTIARQNGFQSSPSRAASILEIPFHGSQWPYKTNGQVSEIFAAGPVPQPSQPGFWSPETISTPWVVGTVVWPTQWRYARIFAEWMVEIDAGTGGQSTLVLGDAAYQVTIQTDQAVSGAATISVQLKDLSTLHVSDITPATGHTLTGVGWHQVAVGIDFNFFITTGITTQQVHATVWADGVPTVCTPVNVFLPASGGPSSYSFLSQIVGVENLIVSAEGLATPSDYAGFAPTAFIDVSLNQMVATVDVSDLTDGWGVTQLVAEAELGIGGLDPAGIYRFRNRNTLTATPPVRTIRGDRSLTAVGTQTSQASIYNHVQVGVNSIYVGPPAYVWAATDVPVVSAHATVVMTVSTDQPVVNLSTAGVGPIPVGGTPGTTGWRACRAVDGAGPEVTTGITVTVTQQSPTALTVTIVNSNAFTVYLVCPIGVGYPTTSQGLPALNIGGRNVLTTSTVTDGTETSGGSVVADAQWPPASEGGSASSARGDRPLIIQENRWVQDLPTGMDLANHLLARTGHPCPTLTDVVIFNDPRLVVGDKVTVDDSMGRSGIVADAMIVSIRRQDDWIQSLDLRTLNPPGAWLLGVAGSSELGVTTYV